MSANKGGAKVSAKSYSRAIINYTRLERRANPRLKDLFKRERHRSFVMSRRNDPKLAALRERYEFDEMVGNTAARLFEQYSIWGERGDRIIGPSWASCVQAARTDWVPQFHVKWGEKIRKFKESSY